MGWKAAGPDAPAEKPAPNAAVIVVLPDNGRGDSSLLTQQDHLRGKGNASERHRSIAEGESDRPEWE
jgi:hypothetical protein